LRMRSTPEGALELSSEAIWGMIGFATLPPLAAIGTLYAAWQSRSAPKDAPWDHVDVQKIGGGS
jgi:hypothetical protein